MLPWFKYFLPHANATLMPTDFRVRGDGFQFRQNRFLPAANAPFPVRRRLQKLLRIFGFNPPTDDPRRGIRMDGSALSGGPSRPFTVWGKIPPPFCTS